MERYPDEIAADFAEVYNLYSFKGAEPFALGSFFVGLGENSRTMRALSGRKLDRTTELLALILDKLSNLVWMLSEDGRKKRNMPESIHKMLTDPDAGKDKDRPVAFATGAELDAELARIREAAAAEQQKGGT